MTEEQVKHNIWKDPAPWLYIGFMILFFVILVIKSITSPTLKIISIFGLFVAQLLYTIKNKENKSTQIFPNFSNWAGTILLLLFAISYTAATVKEITFGAITFLFTLGTIMLGALVLNFSTLFKSKTLVGIILSYIMLAFGSILFFGFMYNIFSGFPEHQIISQEGNHINEVWNYLYFSSSVFYTNTFGDILPQGFSKVMVQIELLYSFIVHIIVLGAVIPKLK